MLVTKRQLRRLIREEIQKIREDSQDGWKYNTGGAAKHGGNFYSHKKFGDVAMNSDGKGWSHVHPHTGEISHKKPFRTPEEAMSHAEKISSQGYTRHGW